MKVLILICAFLLAGCNPHSPEAIKKRQHWEAKCRSGCEEVGHKMRNIDPLVGCICHEIEVVE